MALDKTKKHPFLKSTAALVGAAALSAVIATRSSVEKVSTDTKTRIEDATIPREHDAGAKEQNNKRTNVDEFKGLTTVKDTILSGDTKTAEKMNDKYVEIFKKHNAIGKDFIETEYEKEIQELIKESGFSSKEEFMHIIRGVGAKKAFETIESDDLADKAQKALEQLNVENPTKDYLDIIYANLSNILIGQGESGEPFEPSFLEQTGLSKEELQDKVREVIAHTIEHTGGAGSPWILNEELKEIEDLKKYYDISSENQ